MSKAATKHPTKPYRWNDTM